MACGCGRSEDGCRGWHALTEEEYKIEYEKFLQEKNGNYYVREVEHYTDTLFKFKLDKPEGFDFKAGQFTMISVEDAPKRAYSMVSAPQDGYLEFYSIKVPGGALTSKLKNIQVGDFVNVSNRATGNLMVENLDEGRDLWLMATGTGIAPFISMLCDDYTYSRFKNIHVVWSVRVKEELLAFDEWLKGINIDYVPIVTQDETWNGIDVRMTSLIQSGVLMADAIPVKDKVMLCGSMDFNKEMKAILEERGWSEGSNRENGSFVLEKAFVG